MARTSHIYHFGRLNVLTAHQDKKEFLREAFSSKKKLVDHGNIWVFVGTEELIIGRESFLYGMLVKCRTDKAEVVNLNNLSLEDVAIQDHVAGKSTFFVHVKTGLIAYHPDGARISVGAFTRMFCELIEETHERMFVQADIQSIEDSGQVIESLRRFDKIVKVEIELVPSNPNSGHMWETVDKRIQRIGGTNYREIIEARETENGLDVENDEETMSKLYMVHDGYGDASVTGYIDGEREKLHSKRHPVTAEAPADTDAPVTILTALVDTFRKIIDKIKGVVQT